MAPSLGIPVFAGSAGFAGSAQGGQPGARGAVGAEELVHAKSVALQAVYCQDSAAACFLCGIKPELVTCQ